MDRGSFCYKACCTFSAHLYSIKKAASKAFPLNFRLGRKGLLGLFTFFFSSPQGGVFINAFSKYMYFLVLYGGIKVTQAIRAVGRSPRSLSTNINVLCQQSNSWSRQQVKVHIVQHYTVNPHSPKSGFALVSHHEH